MDYARKGIGMSVFTDRVSMLIKERGISKSTMLKDLHMGSGTFATWEKRGTIPGGDTLGILAEYFQVSVDYLLGKTDQKEAPTAEKAIGEIQDVYFRLAKSFQDSEIDPDDIQLALETIKRLREKK